MPRQPLLAARSVGSSTMPGSSPYLQAWWGCAEGTASNTTTSMMTSSKAHDAASSAYYIVRMQDFTSIEANAQEQAPGKQGDPYQILASRVWVLCCKHVGPCNVPDIADGRHHLALCAFYEVLQLLCRSLIVMSTSLISQYTSSEAQTLLLLSKEKSSMHFSGPWQDNLRLGLNSSNATRTRHC